MKGREEKLKGLVPMVKNSKCKLKVCILFVVTLRTDIGYIICRIVCYWLLMDLVLTGMMMVGFL